MRMLPRSARGTWLLAAAAWVGGCVALWYALPEVPRATLRLPIDADLVGFGPNGESALTRRDIEPNVGALDLLELPSGRLLSTFFERYRSDWLTILGKSADHRIWLVGADVAPERQIFKLDLAARTVDALPSRFAELAANWPPTLAPNGRICVFPDPIKHAETEHLPGYETVVWDVVNNRQRGVLPGPYSQFAFSADGRSVAAEVLQQDCVRIFDLDSLAVRGTLSAPSKSFVNRLVVSDDGTRAAVEFSESPSDQHRGLNRTFINAGPYRAELPRGGLCVQTADLSCFDVVTGKASIRAKLAQSQFAASGRVLIANGGGADDEFICAYDTANGRIRYSIPRHPVDEWEVSPDGRTLFHIPDESPIGPVEKIVHSIGLPWPFAPAIGYARAQLYATIDGRHLGSIPARRPKTVDFLESPVMAFRWFPDGQTLATMPDPEHSNVWELWDIPPRKPLTWFALAAVGLALPLAWLAGRRIRHLRSVAAIRS
jgi:hypothetical protein